MYGTTVGWYVVDKLQLCAVEGYGPAAAKNQDFVDEQLFW